MRKLGLILVFVLPVSLSAQPCQKIVNINGDSVDISCPDGPPGYDVGTLYESDDTGDWSGGQKHNCLWPGKAYAYIYFIDPNETCHVMTKNSIHDFGVNFHGVCLGTYYVNQNTTHKNIANVGYEPGDGFACNERGDNCFEPPGSESSICSENNEGACFSEVTSNCHILIKQGSCNITCKTAGTGE